MRFTLSSRMNITITELRDSTRDDTQCRVNNALRPKDESNLPQVSYTLVIDGNTLYMLYARQEHLSSSRTVKTVPTITLPQRYTTLPCCRVSHIKMNKFIDQIKPSWRITTVGAAISIVKSLGTTSRSENPQFRSRRSSTPHVAAQIERKRLKNKKTAATQLQGTARSLSPKIVSIHSLAAKRMRLAASDADQSAITRYPQRNEESR